jgi:dTMP kinase
MGNRGRFIVIEGGEGAGKSTQAALLAEALGADLTREPGGTPLAEQIRSLLLDLRSGPLSARAELLLMVAARAQHVEERILPALVAGRDVVCDRFSGSTIAYQGHGRGLPLEDIVVANELATHGVEPDLVVLLEVSPETAAARLSGVADRIESAGADFHARVADGFRELAAANTARWVVIDANGEPAAVAKEVAAAVAARLSGAGSTRR